MNIENRCKKIKIVLTDVDGVLTDGGMYYTKDGDVMKRFHVRDGMGVSLLRKNKILTIIVTKETTQIVRKWAKKMNWGSLIALGISWHTLCFIYAFFILLPGFLRF